MTPLGSCMLPLLVLPLADASPPTRPSAVVLKESRGESGEWVLFDCTNKLCAYKMMHAECYARLVSWGGGGSPRPPITHAATLHHLAQLTLATPLQPNPVWLLEPNHSL